MSAAAWVRAMGGSTYCVRRAVSLCHTNCSVRGTYVHREAWTRSLRLHAMLALVSRSPRTHPLHHRRAIVGYQSCVRIALSVHPPRLQGHRQGTKHIGRTWPTGSDRTIVKILRISSTELRVAALFVVEGHCDCSGGTVEKVIGEFRVRESYS